MKVVEIFDSMQGEGEYMGVMCTFVRLAGCNLQCPFCDEHSKYGKATEMSIPEIVEQCEQQIVVITGGEPTIQPELTKLINALWEADHGIHMETNGTNPLPWRKRSILAPDVWVTCSPKAPKYEVKCKYDEIKLVVSEDLTLEQALQISNKTMVRVWLQPCDGPWIEGSKGRIIDWIEKYPSKFRAGIQLHKYYSVV